jgi:hypothetical protein
MWIYLSLYFKDLTMLKFFKGGRIKILKYLCDYFDYSKGGRNKPEKLCLSLKGGRIKPQRFIDQFQVIKGFKVLKPINIWV